jgi:hypothetical protein
MGNDDKRNDTHTFRSLGAATLRLLTRLKRQRDTVAKLVKEPDAEAPGQGEGGIVRDAQHQVAIRHTRLGKRIARSLPRIPRKESA